MLKMLNAVPLRMHAGLWGLDRIDSRSPQRDYAYKYNGDGSGVHIYVVDSVRFVLRTTCCTFLAATADASGPVLCLTLC